MRKALYRKYRSRSLAELVGQEQIVSVLGKSLAEGRVSHAYLFVGPRGTGKTSVARILAHAVNDFKYELEDSYLDIIEIDAASNTGVDNIRDLREKAMIAPSSGKYKIYIIDEVHMLSKSAFNALLKTLEEPPEHVIFIMATTDVQKIPVTIVSRAQKFVFKLVDDEVMVKHLQGVAKAEGIEIDEAALGVIARRGGGSFRDALSLLDQISVMYDGKITVEMVEQALGLPSGEIVDKLLAAYRESEGEKVNKLLREMTASGVRAELVAEELIGKIVAEPKEKLLGLLDKLVEVAGSTHPEVKLLLALVGGEVSAAQLRSPNLSRDSSPGANPPAGVRTREFRTLAIEESELREGVSQNDTSASRLEAAVEEGPLAPISSRTAAPDTREDGLSRERAPKDDGVGVLFSWDKILEGVGRESAPLRAHLSKLQHEVDGGKLRIYAKTKFIKTIVEKGRAVITAQLPEVLELEVLGEAKPGVDDNLEKISAIMGGVTEVKIDG